MSIEELAAKYANMSEEMDVDADYEGWFLTALVFKLMFFFCFFFHTLSLAQVINDDIITISDGVR